VAIQPRIRLMRSFDERAHSYSGYVLKLLGICGQLTGEFTIAVGKSAHSKHQFQIGMIVSGVSTPVVEPRLEIAQLYKTSGIKTETHEITPHQSPPFHGLPPELEVYRSRGHRRLDSRTYDTKCTTCIWGCKMPVELVLDNWKPWIVKYRVETFCYGPKSCALYRAGATRKVPGRGGISWVEENWVDEESTAHRKPDE
jgi:hypothetical protein